MPDIPPVTAPCGGPSWAELRRLDTGEIGGAQRVRFLAHTDKCARCQAVLTEFAADHAALQTTLPFAALEHRLSRHRWSLTRSWQRIVAALLVPVGAVAIFLLVPRPTNQAPLSPMTHLKGGGPGLDFVVKSGDALHDGRDGESLKAGDALRFRYSAGGMPYVLIVGVDADGKVFPYLSSGDRSAKASTGATLAPNAVVLDKDPRPERVFAVYSDQPIGVDEVGAAAKDGMTAAHGQIDRLSSLPGFSSQASLLLNKAR